MPVWIKTAKWSYVACYCLMGIVSPVILFAFALLFGQDSYQSWGDRFHLELTNRYLFSRNGSDSLLGALWREDILGGSPWAANIGPAPVALVILSARLFQLSPFWIDLVGALTLYFIAVASMYTYLRRVLLLGVESSTATAVMFAGTAYWVAHLVGNPDLPVAIACLPALLFMAHQIHWAEKSSRVSQVMLHVAGFAMAFFVFAIHATLASFPIAPMLVFAYAWSVFGIGRSLWWCLVSISIGCVLYSPYAWAVVEATRYSSRFDGGVFFPDQHSMLDPSSWIYEGMLIFARLSLGHSAHGLYLVGILGATIWWTLRSGRERERLQLNRILKFAAWTAVIIPLIEVFHLTIDYVKRAIPLVGGWSVSRSQYASSFSILVLLAWMFDRSLFRLGLQTLSPSQGKAVRMAIVITGLIGSCQIGYSTYRMSQVPRAIYPHNVVLYVGLFLYATTVFALLIWVYMGTKAQPISSNMEKADLWRTGLVTLMVLAVSVTTSVHSYRQGVVGIRGADMKVESDQIMTYRERYVVPEDILEMKRLNLSDGRVVDLTRPVMNTAVGPMGDAPLINLGGLRTPSGYSAAYPAWYERFVYLGINGVSAGPRTIVQVLDTGQTNFEAVGLLDVEYVLALTGVHPSGYEPVPEFVAKEKTLFKPSEEDMVGPAFVSRRIVCFTDDNEALGYIHGARLRELRGRAVLVASDMSAASLCAEREPTPSFSEPVSQQIGVRRGTDRVTVQVETSPGGILTLSDTYYPGWKVLVNGVEQPMLRTYTTLRGVAIEPGRQVVEFIYEPRLFWLLVHLSNAVLAFLLIVILTVWLREKGMVKRKLGYQRVADS